MMTCNRCSCVYPFWLLVESKVFTLTSALSDSAIFLRRSMQRDECLIPIGARRSVTPDRSEERSELPVRLSVLPPARREARARAPKRAALQVERKTCARKQTELQVPRAEPPLLPRDATGGMLQKFAVRRFAVMRSANDKDIFTWGQVRTHGTPRLMRRRRRRRSAKKNEFPARSTDSRELRASDSL